MLIAGAVACISLFIFLVLRSVVTVLVCMRFIFWLMCASVVSGMFKCVMCEKLKCVCGGSMFVSCWMLVSKVQPATMRIVLCVIGLDKINIYSE